MKYEEIKIGDVFTYEGGKETVISKSDRYRIITTIDPDNIPSPWSEEGLHYLKPIKEELPEEGLFFNTGDNSLVYRTSERSGYGFVREEFYDASVDVCFTFISSPAIWKPATPGQETKFIEMLKKECEKHGLFEDTKIEAHADGSKAFNQGDFGDYHTVEIIYNKNGQIFYKGKFATPLKEETILELVSKAVQELGDFIVEQTESGVIILNPIKK